MHEYKCTVVRVVDGDTVDVDIDLGFGVWLRKERVRMFGIDTPESRTRDLEEKKYGLAAKYYLKDMLGGEGSVVLKTQKDSTGKYGRILGELWKVDKNNIMDEKSVNDYMIQNHHAAAYFGQSKDDITEQHIKNREFINLEEWT
jgi:micrococcal nuclease